MDRKISLTLWILLLLNTLVFSLLFDIPKDDTIKAVPLHTIKLFFWILEVLLLVSSILSLLYLDYNTRKEERKINS